VKPAGGAGGYGKAAKSLRDLRIVEVVQLDMQGDRINGREDLPAPKVKVSFKFEGNEIARDFSSGAQSYPL